MSNLSERVLRLPEVKRRTGLSRTSIYNRLASGDFPKPISLGGRSIGWLESEFTDWLQSKVDSSRVNITSNEDLGGAL